MEIHPDVEQFNAKLDAGDTTLHEPFVVTDSMASMEPEAKTLLLDHLQQWKAAFPTSQFYRTQDSVHAPIRVPKIINSALVDLAASVVPQACQMATTNARLQSATDAPMLYGYAGYLTSCSLPRDLGGTLRFVFNGAIRIIAVRTSEISKSARLPNKSHGKVSATEVGNAILDLADLGAEEGVNVFKADLVAGSMVYIPPGWYVGVGRGPQAIEEKTGEMMSGVIATCMPNY